MPVPDRRSAKAERLSPVAALVQRHDRDRFQTVLFAPAARREALFALYAFNYEIARVRESVTQPMLGQIRLEWWRENIAAAFEDRPVRHHIVVEPLTVVIREVAVTRAHFDRLIDARETDFEEDPPSSLATLEDYADATSARLVYLALEILGLRDPVARAAAFHVGIAHGLAGLLRAMPFRARAGRCFIPAEIAARTGLDQEDYRALRSTPAFESTPRSALPALLPAIVAQRSLTRLKRAGYDPFDRVLLAPDPLQSWRLAAASLRNRF